MTSSPPTGGGVIIDLGTGDGSFVYQSARRHPDRFYIGIDPQSSAMEKVSEKIHRKPAKGGDLPFASTDIEDLACLPSGYLTQEMGKLAFMPTLRTQSKSESGTGGGTVVQFPQGSSRNQS